MERKWWFKGIVEEERREPELHYTAISEAVRLSECGFAQADPFQRLPGSSQPDSDQSTREDTDPSQNLIGSSQSSGSLEPTLLESYQLERTHVRSNGPLPEAYQLERTETACLA